MHEQIDIATARDLLGALTNPNLAVCAATLKAIAENPARASALCRQEGLDLFHELLRQCETAPSGVLHAGYVFALLQLDDERRMSFAIREFRRTASAKIILLTAGQIAKLSARKRIELLGPLVMAADNPTRCRAAANLLADCRRLEPEVALRVALLADHEVPIPRVDEDSLDIWLAELVGPYPLATRKLLAKCDAGLAILLSSWARLPESVRIWVLGELAQKPGKAEPGRIREIIGISTGKVLQAALECLRQLPARAGDEALLQPLYQHADASIRAAAFCAGTTRLDWPALLAAEESAEVRQAIIARIEASADRAAISQLASLLQDRHWRIRARATTALVAFAPSSLPTLQNLIAHPEEPVRVSAIRAMYALGQEDWLRQALEIADVP